MPSAVIDTLAAVIAMRTTIGHQMLMQLTKRDFVGHAENLLVISALHTPITDQALDTEVAQKQEVGSWSRGLH